VAPNVTKPHPSPAGPKRTVTTEPAGPALGLTDRLGATVAEAIEGEPTITAAAINAEHLTTADRRHQARLRDRNSLTIPPAGNTRRARIHSN